eukprot:9586264-Lingulodinium_polyedra.AAC.1
MYTYVPGALATGGAADADERSVTTNVLRAGHHPTHSRGGLAGAAPLADLRGPTGRLPLQSHATHSAYPSTAAQKGEARPASPATAQAQSLD